MEEVYKVIGYIDDIKPAITSMDEFRLVDLGSSLFEAASGCILHRDPLSGKVKFLPLGRWKGILQQEDLPVRYIVLSEHLDMVGVQLKSTYTQTRKVNCDALLEKVSNIIGPWKGGKFMPLTMRPSSLNTFCLSKLLFRCSSVDLRAGDHKKITSEVKSWLFADQLEYPEEMVLHRPRAKGGLGLTNVNYKAMAEQIRSFMETSIHPSFTSNMYHLALFQWYVEERRDIYPPKKNPYYSDELFTNIKMVREEGLLKISTMSTGQWYKVLLENNITNFTDEDNTSSLKPCRAELQHPEVDWEMSWSLANLHGLASEEKTFLWRMLHNILPTQQRLHRLGMRNAVSPLCNLCTAGEQDDLNFALIACSFNSEVSDWLTGILHHLLPNLLQHQIVLLNLGPLDEELRFPVVWIISQVLSLTWDYRKEKKKPRLFQTRANLEAGIAILRKTRFSNSCNTIEEIIATL